MGMILRLVSAANTPHPGRTGKHIFSDLPIAHPPSDVTVQIVLVVLTVSYRMTLPFGHAGMTRVMSNVIKRDPPSGLAVCRGGRGFEQLMCDERVSDRPATDPQDEPRSC